MPGPSFLRIAHTMAGFDDEPKSYKEKTWNNNEDENIINGYSLRGGHVSKDVEGTHFRVLDARKNGIALEIEVEKLRRVLL